MKAEATKRTAPVTPHATVATSITCLTWSLPPPPPPLNHDVSSVLEFIAVGNANLFGGEGGGDDDPSKNDVICGEDFSLDGGGL